MFFCRFQHPTSIFADPQHWLLTTALPTNSLGVLSGLFFCQLREGGIRLTMLYENEIDWKPQVELKGKILVSIQVRQKCSWNEKGSSWQTLGSCPCFRELGIHVGSAKQTLFTPWRIPNAPDAFRTSWTCWTCSMARCWHIFEFCRRVWRHLSKTEDLMGAVGNFQWYAGCLLDRTTALLFLVIDIHRPTGRSYPIEHEQHLHQYAPGDPVGSSWYHKSRPSPRSCWWVFAGCACCPETSCCKPFQPFMNKDILLNPSRITQFLGASCWKGCHRGDTPRIHVLLVLHSNDLLKSSPYHVYFFKPCLVG